MNEEFDLKDFRENKLKMTQAAFAELLGMRQDAISRLEKNPNQMTIEILFKIARCTGMTPDQLMSYKKNIPNALIVKNTWKDARFLKKQLLEYLNSFKMDSSSNDEVNDCEKRYSREIEEMRNFVEGSLKKPKVVFLGRSDSGKSTIINSLIGKDKMPTSWTPVTSITVYIKHIDDKPSFIEEELWIFKKGKNNDWDDTRLDDEDYCREWKIIGGNAEMLTSYGTRQGEEYKLGKIGSAVLFVDSDILKNCDLVDVPGFTGGIASDNEAADKSKGIADILVYLSTSNGGFLNSEDLSNLKDAMTQLSVVESSEDGKIPKLANLFVVASQAQNIDLGNKEKIEMLLNDGAERLWDSITDKFWTDRKKYTGLDYDMQDLRKRFFSYSTDIENLRNDFEIAMRETIELYPRIIEEKAKIAIKNRCSGILDSITKDQEKYNGLDNEREKYEEYLSELNSNEPIRKEKTMEETREIKKYILKLNDESKKEFSLKYENVLSEEHIVSTIKRKKYKSKKEDMQLLASYINSEIKDEMNSILEMKSSELNDRINEFIEDFSNSCRVGDSSFDSVNMNGFNAQRAFASGLAGAATLGGLAFWASTLGNLGAYILVAKGVSVLSAIGIHVGGTAAAASFVASIGGPVVLGIVLAVIAALGVFGVFSVGWEKKVAKKIKEAYKKQNALLKCNDCIDGFWKDTDNAFSEAVESMEEEWQDNIQELKNVLEGYDKQQIEKCIRYIGKVKVFFEKFPL